MDLVTKQYHPKPRAVALLLMTLSLVAPAVKCWPFCNPLRADEQDRLLERGWYVVTRTNISISKAGKLRPRGTARKYVKITNNRIIWRSSPTSWTKGSMPKNDFRKRYELLEMGNLRNYTLLFKHKKTRYWNFGSRKRISAFLEELGEFDAVLGIRELEIRELKRKQDAVHAMKEYAIESAKKLYNLKKNFIALGEEVEVRSGSYTHMEKNELVTVAKVVGDTLHVAKTYPQNKHDKNQYGVQKMDIKKIDFDESCKRIVGLENNVVEHYRGHRKPLDPWESDNNTKTGLCWEYRWDEGENSIRYVPINREECRQFDGKVVFLDLDETLFHSHYFRFYKDGEMMEEMGKDMDTKKSLLAKCVAKEGGADFKIEVNGSTFYTYKRPHCNEFLNKIPIGWKVIVLTSADPVYAEKLVSLLYEDHCRNHHDGGKPLRIQVLSRGHTITLWDVKPLFPCGFLPENVVLVDNTLQKIYAPSRKLRDQQSDKCYTYEGDNYIPVRSWKANDPNDYDLLLVADILEHLDSCKDVRPFLKNYFGSKIDQACEKFRK